MKSNSIFFITLTLAAPLALVLQGTALAQANGGAHTAAVIDVYWQDAPAQADGATSTPPPAQVAGAVASTFRQNVDFYFPGGQPSEFLQAVDKQYKVDWAKVADIPLDIQGVHIPALRLSPESLDRIPYYPNGVRGGGRRAGRGFGGGGGAAGGGGGGGGLGGADFGGGAGAAGSAGGGGGRGGADVGGGGGGGFRRGGAIGAAAGERNPLEALVALYNSLAQAKPELGELILVGDLAKPSIVMFHYSAPVATTDFKLKAFALKGIPEAEWTTLAEQLERQLSLLTRLTHESQIPRKTNIEIHNDTGLLIVIGPEPYLEAAESMVTAWRENHTPAAPATSSGTAVPPNWGRENHPPSSAATGLSASPK